MVEDSLDDELKVNVFLSNPSIPLTI